MVLESERLYGIFRRATGLQDWGPSGVDALALSSSIHLFAGRPTPDLEEEFRAGNAYISPNSLHRLSDSIQWVKNGRPTRKASKAEEAEEHEEMMRRHPMYRKVG